MNRKSADYYEFKDGWAPYWDDLLCGKLRIWEVPPEHRTLQAFTFAMRWARDTCPQKYSYTEKKLIEHFLLSDIIETHKTRDRRHGELYELYDQYYNPDGLNIFNSEWVPWED